MIANRWAQLLFTLGGSFANAQYATQNETDFGTNCAAIASGLAIENATVYFSQFVTAGTNLSIPDRNATCGSPFQPVTGDLCRIALYVATSNASGINMEAWLPSNFSGRFLSTGNGGLGGCIDYENMAYTAGLGFASVGANNGHNGTSGGAFFNQPGVIEDFAYRSLHTGVVVGKEISKQFYGEDHTKSYYLGCSTGGRQGFKAAQDFPEDFDGIVAGAPAVAFNSLISWSAHFINITGPPTSETFVPLDMWLVIHDDILKQCDALDGVTDGVIEDPDFCNYDPSGLICNGTSTNATSCLTATQAQTVTKVFEPLTLANGTLIYPRMQPGSEAIARFVVYNGAPFTYGEDWFRYVVYNDPSFDASKVNDTDYINALTLNPFDIQTFDGDLSAVRDRGAKILHYHGLMDGIISSDNSPRYYNHVAASMNQTPAELDAFYRFFRISGLAHCSGGDGASSIGQNIDSVASLDPAENVLTALVAWVEDGAAPETITGTRWVDGVQAQGVDYKRAHCKYPATNKYKGEGDAKAVDSWACVDV